MDLPGKDRTNISCHFCDNIILDILTRKDG